MIDAFTAMTEKTRAMFAEANDNARTQFEKGSRAFEDMTAFQRENVDAIVESSKIAAKGIEQMGHDAAAYVKSSYEQATGAVRSLGAIKSPADFFQLQSDFARTSFDAFMAHASRSTESALKLAGEVAQPVSNRVALAVEKVKTAAA
ncbi:phasin family protein [Sphingomonas sp.]|jgi:phasin family protein|uniref:phasin family protein n=1 Tax=Sphingomonas sp. TaxID=28214 RepID=UPI00262458E7|nr:phasin family protein [Sphingomonas sp.]MDF2494806.1 phasin family protein [Sphingomonas sp.]